MSKLPMPFEKWTTYKGHSGIDFPYPMGTPIKASGPGYVALRARNDRGGVHVLIKYDAFPKYVGYYHMPDHAKTPREGARVDLGTVIGHVGSTGNSTGPHLHAEIPAFGTQEGFWQYFDKTKWVGQSVPTTPKEDEEMPISFINVRGKTGVNHAGTFAVMRDNAGKLFAQRVTKGDVFVPGIPVMEPAQLAAWRNVMPFQDL